MLTLSMLVARPGATLAYLSGDGKGAVELDCLIGLEGVAMDDLTPFKRTQAIQCTDCDPACDRDGIGEPNQACTFEIAICLNHPDVPGCQPQAIKKAKARPRNLNLIVPASNADTAVCGSTTSVVVATKKRGRRPGQRKIRLLARPKGRGKDKDAILFVCHPRPDGEACPAPPPTTTTVTVVTTTVTETTIIGSTSTTTTTTSGSTSTTTTMASCRSRVIGMRVDSTVGSGSEAAQWPGGTELLEFEPGCSVSVARPSGNVAAAGDGFVVDGFVGFDSCFGAGGDDDDGCVAPSCPGGETGTCEGGRPRCPAGGEGVGEAIFRIRCNGSDTLPVGFVDNLLIKEKLGEWTREEGIIASLRLIAGEVDSSGVLRQGALVSRDATGILSMANEYLETGSDPDALAEIERLMGELVLTDAQLQAMAGLSVSTLARGVAKSIDADCAKFYAPFKPPVGIGACIQQESLTVEGKQYRVYSPAPPLPSAGWSTETHVQWARQAISDSVPPLAGFSEDPALEMPAAIVQLSARDLDGFTDAFAAPWFDPCVITVFKHAQGLIESDFKQTVAHELGHCLEGATFPVPYKVPLETRRWWDEGLAEYMSNVVYPDNNLEWGPPPGRRQRIGVLQTVELATSVLDRSYSNFIFFQYLANEIGHDAIVAMIATLTTPDQAGHLAAIDGMAELHHEFVKALTDRTIRDTNGFVIPYEMTPANRPMVDVATMGPMVDFLEPFGVLRYHLVLDLDRQADLLLVENGPIEDSSRPVQGGRWLAAPVSLPDRCSESVVVLTTAAPATTYEMEVEQVRDAPGQCELEGEWLVDNDSLNVRRTGFTTDYVKGEIRGTFRADGTVDVVYDNWEFRVSDVDQFTTNGINVERYDEFTHTTNATGVTTYEVSGDRMYFGDFFESSYLNGMETIHWIRRYTPSGITGLDDFDRVMVNDAIGEDVFSGLPKFELSETLRFLDPIGDNDVILHRLGGATD